MNSYQGDYAVDSTVYIYFTTHDKNGGAVAPSSAFEVADVKLYKNGSATQRASEAGWTMTSPLDSITGLHLLAIDTSDNTDAGFYAAGGEYTAVLSADETIDSESALSVIGSFSLERTNGALARLKAIPAVDVTKISGDSNAADNLESACDNYSATRGLSGTALPAAAADAAGGIPISDAGGLDLDSKLANTNEVTAARMGALTDWINGGRLDLLIDAIKTATDKLTFTSGSSLDANIKKVNDVEITGNGTTTPWGPV